MLEVKGVSTFYGRVQAINDVNLHIGKGEIVTIIGSNGAGKSTTLMTMSGVLTPKSGEIRFEGRDIIGMAPHQVARLGVVHSPEGRRILPSLSVRENLDMGGFTRSSLEREETLSTVFEMFPRLAERQGQAGGTLSGGEQQMLAMGRAMMLRPRILLLDEPSLGLSPKMIDHIFAVIQNLNSTGITIVLVEQNASMALDIADRGYVLETGRIVAEGDSASLRANPSVMSAYLGI